MKNKNWLVEDQLNKSLIEKANLGGTLSDSKERGKDDSVEILLNEVDKYKQLYENAVKASSDNGEYKRLLAEVEKSKDQSSRAEEKLFAMLEYEVKYKEAKVDYLLLDSSISCKLLFLDVQYGSSLIDPVLLQEET